MPNLQISQTLVCAVAAGVALAPTLIGYAASSDPIIAPGAELKELFNGAHFTEGGLRRARRDGLFQRYYLYLRSGYASRTYHEIRS